MDIHNERQILSDGPPRCVRENLQPHQGLCSPGLELLSTAATTSANHTKTALKQEHSSCIYNVPREGTDPSVNRDSTVLSKPQQNELSNLAKNLLDSVMYGVKCEQIDQNGNESHSKRVMLPKSTCNMYCCKPGKYEALAPPIRSVPPGPTMATVGNAIPRKHQCEQCSYSTDNRSHLRRHFSSVHCSEKQFSCYICSKEFSRLEMVKVHVIRMHPEIKYERERIKKGDVIRALEKSDIKNSVQKKGCRSVRKSPEKQRKNSYDLECASCNIGQPYKDLERKFRCPKCVYVGKDVWHLKRHMTEIHDGLKSFQCVDCNYSSSRKHRMISHMKTHGQLKCFYCSFGNTDLDNFHAHLNECTRQHRAARYPCTVCDQAFGVRKTYAKHMMDVHSLQLYTCDECLYFGSNYDDFFMHKASHERQGLRNADEGEAENGGHFCAPCNELFPGEESLQNHVDKVHSGKVLSFKTLNDQQVEVRKRRRTENCPICGKLFKERFELRNHMFDKHDHVLQVETETEGGNSEHQF